MPGNQYHVHSAPVQPARSPIVVGVVPGQPSGVVEHAARFAVDLDAEIVCVWVDPASYMEGADDQWDERPVPIDPDVVDSPVQDSTSGMVGVVEKLLKPFGITWSFQARAGEPAKELSRVATSLQASMIVVGTREPGIRARFEELLTGSVAVHLAHHQSCPVMVVPLHPSPFSEARR